MEKIVTIASQSNASNTFILRNLKSDEVVVYHPLAPGCYFIHNKNDLDKVPPMQKNSFEKMLGFANFHSNFLDFNATIEIESLCLYYVIKKKLTSDQKKKLSNFCGIITSHLFDNNIQEAIKLIKNSVPILDDFNLMWYNNFKKLFDGTQQIVSRKQREGIFNIAGFVLAELSNTKATITK